MPRLLFFYLMRRMAVGAIVVEAALCVPVVLSYLLASLPAAAVRGGLVGAALVGVAPTVTYLALPMAVGVAVAMEFSRMASEGMIAVLYALRLSVWSICRPALILALLLAGVGLALANFVAPEYQGKCRTCSTSCATRSTTACWSRRIFILSTAAPRRFIWSAGSSQDIAVNLFVRQISVEKMEEQTITASRAEFRRNESGVVVALTRGSIQTRPLNSNDVRIAAFDEYAIVLPMQGSSGLPPRNWRGVYELPAGPFIARLFAARADPRMLAEWTTEAAMRIGVPMLTLGHAMLAMALVLGSGNITGRRGAGGSWIIIAIPAAHIAFLVVLQSLLRSDARFALLLAGLVLLEILGSAWIIAGLNRGPRVLANAARPNRGGREALAA